MRGRDDKKRRKEHRQEQQKRQRQPKDDRAALDKLIAVLAGARDDANKQQ